MRIVACREAHRDSDSPWKRPFRARRTANRFNVTNVPAHAPHRCAVVTKHKAAGQLRLGRAAVFDAAPREPMAQGQMPQLNAWTSMTQNWSHCA